LTRRVLHPFLFAAFPVLYLMAANLSEAVSVGDIVPSLAVVLGGTALVMLVATLALRDARRAGIVASGAVLLFFSYGYVSRLVEGWAVGGLVLGRHRYLVPLWGVLALGSVVLAIRIGRRLRELTTVLNVVSAGLVLLNVVPIVTYRTGSALRGPVLEASPFVVEESSHGERIRKPDIYYIVLDRYGGSQILEEMFGFDNHEFLDFLRARGFYVAEDSHSNYPRTSHSLASSLNMTLLDSLTREVGAVSDDLGPLIQLLGNHAVGRTLKSAGYRYLHIGSWWHGTASSPLADMNLDYRGLSEFSTRLFETTVLDPFGGAISEKLDFARREYGRVLFQFQHLAKSRRMRGPKFVFAHILSPHEPFVFDQRGNFLTKEVRASRSRRVNYTEQLQFINTKLMELVDTLQAGPEESRPVIILQADEGPFEGPGSWRGASGASLRRKFSILNAFYLPGVDDPGLYPSITPVNSFRVVFNQYFDARLPLVRDESYVYLDLHHLYAFEDVTERLSDALDSYARSRPAG
jgi:hypothetical protein